AGSGVLGRKWEKTAERRTDSMAAASGCAPLGGGRGTVGLVHSAEREGGLFEWRAGLEKSPFVLLERVLRYATRPRALPQANCPRPAGEMARCRAWPPRRWSRCCRTA